MKMETFHQVVVRVRYENALNSHRRDGVADGYETTPTRSAVISTRELVTITLPLETSLHDAPFDHSLRAFVRWRTPSPFPRKLVSETVTPTTPMMMMIQNVIFVCTCLYVYTVRI